MQRSIPSRSVCGKCRRPPPIKGPGRDRRWRCASHCRAELEGPARRLDPADAEKPRQLTAGELADKVGSLETRIAALKLEAIRRVEGEDLRITLKGRWASDATDDHRTNAP
jgi:hypothetical protein